MSRYRPDPQSRYRAPLGQLSLPLDYSQSERSDPFHNSGRSKARRSRLSPDRLAKYQEMRERRGIEQGSCRIGNPCAENRQEQRKSLLTPKMLTLIVMSNAKRWTATDGSALPPLRRRPHPFPREGRAHVGRRSPRRLQANPLGRDRRPASLPAMRLLRLLRL